MAEKEWKSSISDIGPGKIRVRGYDIAQIMDRLSYAEAVFLLLKGELPTKAEAEMMRAILVSSIDHGPSPPSVLGARNVVSGGNPLNSAVAGGVLVIGDTHGGAIEKSAKIMQEWAAKDGEVSAIATDLVEYLKSRKIRMPGFGHRLHNVDPRTIKLFEIAARHNFSGRHIELCRAIESALAEKLGKKLPINVDGAIARRVDSRTADA
jgi:citrate synthase